MRPSRLWSISEARVATRDDERKALDALDRRIAEARESANPRRSVGADKFTAASLAWRMVTELVVGMAMGLGMGWGLDSLFGTMPAFLVLFGLLGFAAGVRTMMRSAEEVRRRDEAAQRAQQAGGRDQAPPGADGN
jgi:ATP synthase protein I